MFLRLIRFNVFLLTAVLVTLHGTGVFDLSLEHAQASTYTLYHVTTNAASPTTADQFTTTSGTEDMNTKAKTGTNTKSAGQGYLFKPGVTNSTAYTQTSALTATGWQWEAQDLANDRITAGSWTLTVKWQATATACRGILNYRVTTTDAAASAIVNTLINWTEDSTTLVPTTANQTFTRTITTASIPQTDLGSTSQFLYVEWYIRPTTSCGATSGTWSFGENTSSALTTDISPTPATQTQNYFRFYQNKDAIQPDTALAAENTAITDVKVNQAVRLRMSIQVASNTLASGQTYKLQYGQNATCSAVASWTDVGAVGSAVIWRGYDNTTPADGATITARLLSVSDVSETYEEANNSVSSPGSIAVGQDGEWDWVVQHNGATDNTAYCFRMVKSDNTALDTYTNYPKLTTRAGALSVNSPTSASLAAVTYKHTSQNNAGNALGTTNVTDDRAARPGWTVNITGIDWTSMPNSMDYDGNGTSTGQLTINMGATTLVVNEGSGTGVSLGSTASFSSTTTQILFVQATSGHGDGNYDVTSTTLGQFIPAQQKTGTYTTTLTFTAS